MAAYVIAHVAKRGPRSPRTARSALAKGPSKRLLAQYQGVLLAESGAADGEAALAATIAVPDMARAEALAKALIELDDIETAYAKPGEELP